MLTHSTPISLIRKNSIQSYKNYYNDNDEQTNNDDQENDVNEYHPYDTDESYPNNSTLKDIIPENEEFDDQFDNVANDLETNDQGIFHSRQEPQEMIHSRHQYIQPRTQDQNQTRQIDHQQMLQPHNQHLHNHLQQQMSQLQNQPQQMSRLQNQPQQLQHNQQPQHNQHNQSSQQMSHNQQQFIQQQLQQQLQQQQLQQLQQINQTRPHQNITPFILIILLSKPSLNNNSKQRLKIV